MPAPKTSPYGSWKSPITSDLIVSDGVSLSSPTIVGDDIYWAEMRPTEGGRTVIVQRTNDGKTHDLLPAPYNARTRVHEYGGGAWMVAEETLYFSNFADQRLYSLPCNQANGGVPTPLTAEPEPPMAYRYADGILDQVRQCLIYVREDHTQVGHSDAPTHADGRAAEAVNTLVSIDLGDDALDNGTILVSGHDFYASPRLSPDGNQLAWIAWNHPHMPWTTTELWLADVNADGSLSNATRIAGGDDESVNQPAWSPDGVLYFSSDRSGWWNLYRWQDGGARPILEMEAEFDGPKWQFNLSTYAFASAEKLICTYKQGGNSTLATIERQAGLLRALDLPYSVIGGVRAAGSSVLFTAASPTTTSKIVRLDLASAAMDILRESRATVVDDGYISVPQAVEFPTTGERTAHAFFYPPQNHDFVAPADEKPPLIVIIHGGPTGATNNALSLSIQYWTSRGFGILDVNYGGSTGYGRAYRKRLDGEWGIVDVDDCANGARYLAEQGLVDGERLMIRGGSAGGYTTLAALTFRDVFKAGASHFGVSDIEALAKETHKFESRYMDSLVGPYPQQRDLYQERSPLHHVEHLSCPVIFFQGLEDKIVLPNQAEMMVDALKAKGVPVAYLPFEGEQHGFRQAKNIRRALEAELYFYAQIFGFALAEEIEPVKIENLS